MKAKCDLCDAPSHLHNCQLPDQHSPGCERVRVPVQGDGPWHLPSDHQARIAWTIRNDCEPRPPGWIDPEEHAEVHAAYEHKWGRGMQSADRIAERGGFSHLEAVTLLGRPLRTWRPRK